MSNKTDIENYRAAECCALCSHCKMKILFKKKICVGIKEVCDITNKPIIDKMICNSFRSVPLREVRK